MGMQVVREGLQFCPDCACYAANGDTTGIDDTAREAHVIASVNAFGQGLVAADSGPAYSSYKCASCGIHYEGDSHMFAVLAGVVRMNDNGLTWDEWYAAATLGGKHEAAARKAYGSQALPFATLKAEWLDGVDPTEWAAHFEKGSV